MCVATLFAASGTLPFTQDIGLQLSTSNGAGVIGQPSPNPTNCLGRAHAPLPVQQMLMVEHNSMLNFDPMETVHRKVSKDVDLVPCGIASSDNQVLSQDVDSSQQLDCLIMGGCDRMAANHDNNYLESVENGIEITEGRFSSQEEEGTTPTVATTTDSSDHEGQQSVKTTWTKFEDGLLLLLNLIASITLSSSQKPKSIHKPSSPDCSEQSSGTFMTSSNPPHTHDCMDSETTGLSTMQLQYRDSSFQDGKQTAARNVSTYWWEGESWPQTCFIDGTTGYVTTSRNPQLGPNLKHNATVHYSQDEVVSVDTTARCVCTSRYSESLVVTSSPNLNARQLAVDLHWQGGGTGETDQSILSHRAFNSTPLNLGWSVVNATKFTLTENLLIYANSLLTMAF